MGGEIEQAQQKQVHMNKEHEKGRIFGYTALLNAWVIGGWRFSGVLGR